MRLIASRLTWRAKGLQHFAPAFLVRDQITNTKDSGFISTAAAIGRVNDNGRLRCRIGGREGPIFHGFEAEPCLSDRAQLQFLDKRLPAQYAVRWVGRAVAGVVGDDLVDPHLDTTGTAQVTRQATRLSQSLPHRRKHQARQDCNNGHHAKDFNQRKSPSAVLHKFRHSKAWTTQGVDSHAKKSSKAVSTTRQRLGQESRIIATRTPRPLAADVISFAPSDPD